MAEAPDILTGKDGMPFVPIEEKHGEGCTCRFAARIEIDLVAASRACPGDRNPHRGGTIAAQLEPLEPTPYPGIGIDITWPAPAGNGTPLRPWKMLVHDHVTSEPLLAITGLRIVLGGDQWDTEIIQVDIKTFVDADGQPLIGAPAIPVPDPDDPEQFYSKVFRCYVIEMRTPAADPTIPTRESVARGEHTIDEYRKHHGLDNDTQEEHQP